MEKINLKKKWFIILHGIIVKNRKNRLLFINRINFDLFINLYR